VPTDWGEGDDAQIPEEGDEVVIPVGIEMIFNIEETPRLKSIEVNGKLTFLNNDVDRTI
jgi:hypothetical protein